MDKRPLHSLLECLRRTASPPGGGVSDAELLRRFVRQRDEAAFEVLLWRHGPMVLGVCRRVLRDRHGAEDAFQATFLALVCKAGRIARGGAVASWLYRVAFRVALRARAVAAKHAVAAPLPADVPAPEVESTAERDWQPILDEEINRLPERYRQPLVLCHLQGRTLAEAARQLGCPRGTVAVRLLRARQRLRARLTRRGVTLAAALSAFLASQGAVSATLVKTTVRAVHGYAAGATATALSSSAVSLAEGVLRAMFLSKIKVAATVLLALVLAGAGAAWGVYRASAGEPAVTGNAAPAAEPPPAAERKPEPRAEDQKGADARRREGLRKRWQEAEDKLQIVEKEGAEREKQWLREIIEARLKVVELQDEIKIREAELTDRSLTMELSSDLRLRELMNDREKTESRLEEAKRVLVNKDDPPAARLAVELDRLEDKIQVRRKELQQESDGKKRQRADALARLRGLRQDLVVAEEKLRALKRRQQWQQDELRRALEEWSERARRLQEASQNEELVLPPEATRSGDVERKLDQVLRELTELRRSLRRPEEDRPDEP